MPRETRAKLRPGWDPWAIAAPPPQLELELLGSSFCSVFGRKQLSSNGRIRHHHQGGGGGGGGLPQPGSLPTSPNQGQVGFYPGLLWPSRLRESRTLCSQPAASTSCWLSRTEGQGPSEGGGPPPLLAGVGARWRGRGSSSGSLCSCAGRLCRPSARSPFWQEPDAGGGVERQDEDMALIAMVVSILRRRHGQVQAQALTLKAL